MRHAAAAALVFLVLTAPAAQAVDDYVGRDTPEVLPFATDPRDPGRTKVLGQVVERGRIPITGGDLAGLAAIGAGALGTGIALRRRAGRAPDSQAT